MERSEKQIFEACARFGPGISTGFEDVLRGYRALTASKLTGLNKNTTHRLYGLLRARVLEMAKGEAAPFTGSVEVDESYFGPRRVRGRRGRGSGRKVAVIGLLKRKGKVFCSPVMNCSKAELIEVIRGQVLPRKSTIYTDGWRAYDGLVLEGYKHHRIHHHDNEFARKHRHINGIESFWSYAKLRLAKLRGVRWSNSMTTSKKPNGASIIAVITSSTSSSLTSALHL